MNNQIQAFNFEGSTTRIVMQNGEPWVVAKDVCDILGYVWNGVAAIQHVPAQWRGVRSVLTPYGTQQMQCLSEQGLYFFLGRSDKPKALPYQMWISGEVVPSIRKHGVYMTTDKIEEALSDPDSIIKMAQALKDERARREALEARIEADQPKVLFADAVNCSGDAIPVGDLAKILKQNGVEMGRTRLFEYLREDGYLMKRGLERNMPTQKSMEAKLFEVKESTLGLPGGRRPKLLRTPYVTGRGQRYFINHFLNVKADEEANRTY